MKKIGLISALPQELEIIQSHIHNGTVGAYPVVATLSGIGKVNAAMTAQKLISEESCSTLIFSGVAGGLHPAYQIGDVVMAYRTLQHDYGVESDIFTPNAPNTLPVLGIGNIDEPLYIELGNLWDEITWNKIESFATKFSKESFSEIEVNNNQYHPNFHCKATIATGDQFIANDQRKAEIQSYGSDAVEMEGGAVAYVANQNKIPCLIFRAISDTAGKESKVDFPTFLTTVSQNNAHLVVGLLENNLIK